MNDPTPLSLRRSPSGETLSSVLGTTPDAELVLAARGGDRRAFSILFERWFDRSYDVAWRIVRNPDTAAEVAQDTFLVVWEKLDTLRDPEAFGGWVLRTSRNRALNRLEREGRSRAFDTEDTVAMVDRERSAVDVADEIVRQEQHDLVWAAAAALGERDASILDLHLRHDLDPGQIAEALDITPNAAHQTLFRLRKRLEGAIRSYVLWHQGAPECGELAEVLERGGITSFGPSAVKAISGHVASCDLCDERHAAILAPASMFAAVPMLAVGLDVRKAAAAELAAQGVPIDPDLVSGASGGAAPRPVGGAPGQGARRSPAALVGGGIAAVLLLVVALVVGAGLLDGGDTQEVEIVAAPGTTQTAARVVGTAPAPSATAATVDPADAPPASDDPALVDPPATDPDPDTTTTAPPRTTQPSTVVDSTAPPVDTTGTTETTTTAPPPPAPSFTALSLTPTGDLGACSDGSSGAFHLLEWAASGADNVVVSGPGVLAGQRPPAGSLQVCVPSGTSPTWQLTASGSGGSTTTSISAV
jgi:RNA polymerase sigma factor (sigma-70 family)